MKPLSTVAQNFKYKYNPLSTQICEIQGVHDTYVFNIIFQL